MEEDRVLAGDTWQGGECIFANPTGAIRSGPSLTHNFRAHLERHGVEPVRWHALRRVFAALLREQGIPLAYIRDLMGHCVLRVTEGYAYTMPDALQGAMAAMDESLRPRADQPGGAEAN